MVGNQRESLMFEVMSEGGSGGGGTYDRKRKFNDSSSNWLYFLTFYIFFSKFSI